MNLYIVTFYRTDGEDSSWQFVVKLFRADYEQEAKDNAVKMWESKYNDWKISFKPIPYFDYLNSTTIVEFSK